jgi:hypothetical protein
MATGTASSDPDELDVRIEKLVHSLESLLVDVSAFLTGTNPLHERLIGELDQLAVAQHCDLETWTEHERGWALKLRDCEILFNRDLAHLADRTPATVRNLIRSKFAILGNLFPIAAPYFLGQPAPFCEFLRAGETANLPVIDADQLSTAGPQPEPPPGPAPEIAAPAIAAPAVVCGGDRFAMGAAAVLHFGPFLEGDAGTRPAVRGRILLTMRDAFVFAADGSGNETLQIPLRSLEYGLVRLTKA